MNTDTAERATQAAAELVTNVERLVNDRSVTRSRPPLGEGAQMVHNATRKNIDMIFDLAGTRIAGVRKALETMEAGLNTKKASLLDSLENYVAALEMIEKHTATMQAAIGDAVVAQDGVG